MAYGTILADTLTNSGGTSLDLTTTNAKLAAFEMSGSNVSLDAGLLFNGDTADVNTLDDYEQGSWTPEYTCSATAPSITYGVQVGTYTKVGNLVTVGWRIRTTGPMASAGSGDIYVTNLPFTIGDTDFDQRGVAHVWSSNWAAGSNPNSALGRKGENNAQLMLQTSTNASGLNLGGDFNNITAGGFDTTSGAHNQTYCTLTYFVD